MTEGWVEYEIGLQCSKPGDCKYFAFFRFHCSIYELTETLFLNPDLKFCLTFDVDCHFERQNVIIFGSVYVSMLPMVCRVTSCLLLDHQLLAQIPVYECWVGFSITLWTKLLHSITSFTLLCFVLRRPYMQLLWRFLLPICCLVQSVQIFRRRPKLHWSFSFLLLCIFHWKRFSLYVSSNY